jgi:hypothetical protein
LEFNALALIFIGVQRFSFDSSLEFNASALIFIGVQRFSFDSSLEFNASALIPHWSSTLQL